MRDFIPYKKSISMENIIIGDIEILFNDLPKKMGWLEIPIAINNIGGNNWRIPTGDEFQIIYHLCKKGVLPYKLERYWSTPSFSDKALCYDFRIGYHPSFADVSDLCNVKLVRTLAKISI